MDGRGRGTGTLREARPRAAALRRLAERATAVVPMSIRRATRQRTRQAIAMFEGRVSAPRHATAFMVASVLGGSVAYGAILSDSVRPATDAVAAAAGLTIMDLRIDGAVETTDAAIAAAAGVGRIRSLALLDVEAARAAIVALPWVASATVSKSYPGTLVIEIEERVAQAQWRVGRSTLLLDADGLPIVPSDDRNVPLLVGEGADAAMATGLALLEQAGPIAREFKALVRVGDRRWDAITHRNVAVKLPAERPLDALARLTRLHADQSVLDKDLVAIDLRVAGRIAFRLAPGAAELRAGRLADAGRERTKARKAREAQL